MERVYICQFCMLSSCFSPVSFMLLPYFSYILFLWLKKRSRILGVCAEETRSKKHLHSPSFSVIAACLLSLRKKIFLNRCQYIRQIGQNVGVIMKEDEETEQRYYMYTFTKKKTYIKCYLHVDIKIEAGTTTAQQSSRQNMFVFSTPFVKKIEVKVICMMAWHKLLELQSSCSRELK